MESPFLLLIAQSDHSGRRIEALLRARDGVPPHYPAPVWTSALASEPLPEPPRPFHFILYELPDNDNPAQTLADLPAPVLALRPPAIDAEVETAVLAAGAAACMPLDALTPAWLHNTIYHLLILQGLEKDEDEETAVAPNITHPAFSAFNTSARETYLIGLNNILRTVLSQTTASEMLNILAEQLSQLFNADGCHIALFDEENMQTVPTAATGPFAEHFMSLGPVEATQTITYSVLELGQVLGIESAWHSPYVSPNVARYFPVSHSLLALPLTTDARKLGAVILIFTQERTFSQTEIAWGQQAAGLLSLAIAKHESLQTERQQRMLAQTLQQITRYLNQTLDQDQILDLILEQLVRMVPFDSASVMLLQNDRQLRNVANRSVHHEKGRSDKVALRQLDYTQLAHIQAVVAEKQSVIIHDTAVDPRWLKLTSTPKIRSWLGVPLIAKGRVLGLLNLSKAEPNFFTQKHADVCQTLAEHASAAIENARLYTATRRQLDELRILHALAEAGSVALDEDAYIAYATAVIHENLHPYHFGILIFDPESATLYPHPSYRFHDPARGYWDAVPIGEGIAGEVLRTGKPQRIDDVKQRENYIPAEDGMRAELCVPLRVNNRIIGIINAEHPDPGHYSPADLRLLITLADQTATTIEKTRLLAAERARRQEAEQLREATTALTTSLEIDQVLDNILAQLQKVVPYDSAAIFLEENNQLRIVAAKGFPNSEAIIGDCFPTDNQLFTRLKTTKRPIRLDDATRSPHFKAWADTHATRGWMGVPLIVRDEMIGYLTLDSHTLNAYNNNDANLALGFANQAAAAIENARSFAAEQHARQIAETIRNANLALTRKLDLQAVLETLLDSLHTLVNYTSASIYLVEDDQQARLAAGKGYPQETVERDITFSLGENENNTYAIIYHSQKHLIFDDVTQMENWIAFKTTTYIKSWLGLPLRVLDRTVGFFSLDHDTPGFFTEEHVQLLEPLANHASFAIQNAQLYESVTAQAEELAVVSDILSHLNSTVAVTEALPRLRTLLQEIADCGWVTILLMADDTRRGYLVSPVHGPNSLSKGIPLDLTKTAGFNDLVNGRIHITPDLSAEEMGINDTYLYQMGIRSRINLPLVVGDTPIGSLNLGWTETGGSDKAPLPLLQQISQALALGIDRSRLFDKISHRAHQLALLHNLGKQITGALDSQTLADTLTQELCTSFRYERAAILLLDTAADRLTILSSHGQTDVRPRGQHHPLSRGLIGKATRLSQAIIVNDTSTDPDFAPAPNLDVLSEAVLPLKSANQLLGVLDINSTRTNAFDDNDVAILTILADQVATALEKTRLLEETQQNANELAMLADISAALRESLTIADVTTIILEKITTAAPVEQAALALYQIQNNSWTLRQLHPNKERLEMWQTLIATESSNAFATIPDMFDAVDTDLPIRKVNLHSQNRIIGVVLVALEPNTAVTEQDRRLFTAISDIAGNALDRALVLETLEERVQTRTQDLARANERLQELDRLKSQFVSEVSHELRTPVTNLSLYLDLLGKGGAEKQAHYTAVLNRQVERLNQLIADILNLSRLEMGHDTIAMAVVDLNDVVRPILTAHEPRFDITRVELQSDLAPDLPAVWGEPNQLAQVVTNLLANSLNYTPAGWVRVRTFFDETRQQVTLQVADSGMGISSADQTHLFDRFYRGQNVSQLNIPGTGLGLAIVQEIVNLHKGTIEVDSALGKGTTFTIWLPPAQK